MKSKEVEKPDFVEVLKRRRRTLDSWLEDVRPASDEVLIQLKKQYTLSSADEAHIQAWTKAQANLEKQQAKKTDMEDVVPILPEEVEVEEQAPRKRKKAKTSEDTE